MDPHQKAKILFFIRYREPIFDQDDTGTDDHALKIGDGLKKFLDLLFGTKAHDPLDASTVVPAPVKQNDFAGCRQMLDIALKIPLRFFALGGCRERNDAARARIEALGDPLDDAAFAGSIPAFTSGVMPLPSRLSVSTSSQRSMFALKRRRVSPLFSRIARSIR
jgi:hypothetical protein